MIQNLTEKWKKYSALVGLIFTVTVGVFVGAMTYVAYFDQQAYERMQTFLYDCGIDAIGALVAAGLFYGCMRQEGEGTDEFRVLNVSVSAGFVVIFLLYFTAGVPAWRAFTFTFAMLSKLIDLLMIYCFYQYVRRTLGFEGKLAELAEKCVPILLALECAVILSNIFYPTTFRIDEAGVYQATGLSTLEDICLIVTSVVTTILIIRCKRPHNQKVAALTFILLPLVIYVMAGGTFGNASQYGMILVSLIIMYCIIFNEKSSKLAATQADLNTATRIQLDALPTTAPELSALLNKELGGVQDLTLDFAECDYVSSAGLRVLLATFKQMKAAKSNMALANVGENFLDVLQNTGLDAVFGVF